ncbi:MAG: SurA N-terminal domain-containing protein, partial [Ignavibacteriaceae bacterium]
MAMMAKMRSLAPAFIITVGALFVLFMVISDSNVLEALGGRTNDVGSINGVDISYREYQFVLDQQREAQKQQTGEDIADDQWDQFREQVWETLVTQKLLEQEIERLGVTVSDEEIKDIILGDNPPEFLKQNFIDSTGIFNRQLYENALFDPQNIEILIQVEEQVRQQRLTEKLQSLLLASVIVSEDEVLRKFKEQNIFANADYALFPISMFSDSSMVVTEEDMKNYYEKNLDRYKISAQRKFRFVLFINQPSAADTNLVIRNLENVREIVTTDTSDFKTFVDIYSTQPYSLDTVGISTFSTEATDQIKSANNGDIIGPVPSPNGFALYRLIGVIPSSDKMVRASHILINSKENDQANLDEANRIYDELINGADFS